MQLSLGSQIYLFAFIFKEHLDYEIIQSLNPEFNKAVVRVNVFREHRQTIQVNNPSYNFSFSFKCIVVSGILHT